MCESQLDDQEARVKEAEPDKKKVGLIITLSLTIFNLIVYSQGLRGPRCQRIIFGCYYIICQVDNNCNNLSILVKELMFLY